MRVIKPDSPGSKQVQITTLSEFRLAQFKRRQSDRDEEEAAAREAPVVDPLVRPYGAGTPGIDFVEAPEAQSADVIEVDFKGRKRK